MIYCICRKFYFILMQNRPIGCCPVRWFLLCTFFVNFSSDCFLLKIKKPRNIEKLRNYAVFSGLSDRT
nr:MAG TPA: hypothetical protein [Caudoviricetes sp.]